MPKDTIVISPIKEETTYTYNKIETTNEYYLVTNLFNSVQDKSGKNIFSMKNYDNVKICKVVFYNHIDFDYLNCLN